MQEGFFFSSKDNLSLTGLIFFVALALNRCLLQTVQAAYETGGVCCPECGVNQHAQSSLVSEMHSHQKIEKPT